MNKGKPRGPIPSLIGSTLGSPTPVVVKRKCNCKRCSAVLEKDTRCFEIPQLASSFANPRRYCSSCFRSILGKTKTDLEELVAASEV